MRWEKPSAIKMRMKRKIKKDILKKEKEPLLALLQQAVGREHTYCCFAYFALLIISSQLF